MHLLIYIFVRDNHRTLSVAKHLILSYNKAVVKVGVTAI